MDQEILILLCTTAGTVIGVTLGAFLKGYGGFMGKRLATKADIDAILTEAESKRRVERQGEFAAVSANLDAVVQESAAKRQGEYAAIVSSLEMIRSEAQAKKEGEFAAVHANLHCVLEEVRAVTKETKSIEAQIAGRQWDIQTRWSQKKDIYVEILEAVSAMVTTYRKMLDIAERERGTLGRFQDILIDLEEKINDVRPNLPSDLVALRQDLLSSFKALRRSRTLVRVFCQRSALIVINKILIRALAMPTLNRDALDDALMEFETLEKQLAAVAANDLDGSVNGYEFSEDEYQPGKSELFCPKCLQVLSVGANKSGQVKCVTCQADFRAAT